ncbi:hypothetical protein EV426DRAFT_682774 [Tirmania nivea]|nr:hypothetical protein EV426DRAFT_682774 [Tirmania nivea]
MGTQTPVGYGNYEMAFPEFASYGGSGTLPRGAGNGGIGSQFMAEQLLPSQKVIEEVVTISSSRLDRYSFCCGWPMAIDDKDLRINYPIEEHIFQNSDTMEVFDPSFSEPFSPEIQDIMAPSTRPRDDFHYLYKLSVLMRKIANFNMKPYLPLIQQSEKRNIFPWKFL